MATAAADEPLMRDVEGKDAAALEQQTRPLKRPSDAAIAAARRPRRFALLAIAFLALLFLTIHVFFVSLVRWTSFSLEQLTVPDLCHPRSSGEIVVRLRNPSYCAPDVGHIKVTIAKQNTSILQLSVPPFALAAGTSTVVATVAYDVLASPERIHELVFRSDGEFHVSGDIVVHIPCLLIPFSISMNIQDIPLVQHVKGANGSERVLSSGDIVKKKLEEIVTQILKTIALSHFHTESDDSELFAFTDVSFEYTANVLWNLPSLTLKLSDESHEMILKAGVKRFILGGGKTFISAFTEIFKNETGPLESIMQSYLGGHDVALHVGGSNDDTSCLSLRLLDLVDIRIDVPATVDGGPALLRHYAIEPSLKELDSKTHTCLLELRVVLTLHNPLPIRFELFELAFDLYFRDRNASAETAQLLAHVRDRHDIVWTAHDVRNVSLFTAVRDFDTCKRVIGAYMQDHLSFALERGRIDMAAGPGNFSIPFHVADIPIHPPSMKSSVTIPQQMGTVELS
ncbi:hypothetical protein P43SY_003131 [Pythium insidiosum]|uniref:Uncharacterized protein n=1 Tax=Pythium insidiosum TaxID=114742 RepID=A0AAD5MAT7_PYTIN|nr:hypothetical protein P43SY_003131 [Pythium insidiosum]